MSHHRKFTFAYTPYRLKFKEPGGTSRGILTEKLTYLLRATDNEDPNYSAYSEIPIFQGLSKESVEELEECLSHILNFESIDDLNEIKGKMSSLAFGFEQLSGIISNYPEELAFPSEFTSKSTDITINGLVWMGNFEEMLYRANYKINLGFKCIKLKIGAINFQDELNLVKHIRDKNGSELTIRLDANGAFSPSKCLEYLETLAPYGIHSIEQPVKAGQAVEMKRICEMSPIPIALDEDLIGVPIGDERSQMLEFIRPQYIILKPALCYGFSGATDWIKRAEVLNIGWWMTSALESSVGLNAIAQFTGALHTHIPQGLGTGDLYTNNFNTPLVLKGEKLSYLGPAQPYGIEMDKLNWITSR